MIAGKGPRVVLDEQGLVPAVCQDAATGRVLMAAYMNPESIHRTLETGEMVFYSRSRQELWHKGVTSGSYLRLESAEVDCDGDVLLFHVRPSGPACHTGNDSCFFRPLEAGAAPEFSRVETGAGVLDELFQVIRQRQTERPEGSYTTRLFKEGTSRIAQKVVEEAAEASIAAATGEADNLPAEVADLLYHVLVLLANANVPPEAVWQELRQRRQA